VPHNIMGTFYLEFNSNTSFAGSAALGEGMRSTKCHSSTVRKLNTCDISAY